MKQSYMFDAIFNEMNEFIELRQLFPDLYAFLSTKSQINPSVILQNNMSPIDEYEEINPLDTFNKSMSKSAMSLKNSKYNASRM